MGEQRDFSRSLAEMHLSLAELITAAIEDEGIAPTQLLDAAQLTDAELEGIEEGDTTDLTKLAKLLHTLGRRMIINPDFSVQVYPFYEAESSSIHLNSHAHSRSEPMYPLGRSQILVRHSTSDDYERTTTTTTVPTQRQLIHAG
jgi:hypothetical protein